MTKINCTLECGHEIVWNETPDMPGAELPYIGRVAYCPECNKDQEIIEVDPEKIDVETITLSEAVPGCAKVGGSGGWAYTAGEQATIFYDARRGTWGYCLHGVSGSGTAFETDDVTGFENPKAARKAIEEVQ